MCVYLSCDKITETNNLKEEKFIFASWFLSFSSKSAIPLFWTLWQGRYIMTKESSSPHSRQKAERAVKKGPGIRYSFQNTLPITYFLQLCPIFWYPIQLQIHQWIRLLMKLAPLWSNYLLTGTKHSAYEDLGVSLSIQVITLRMQGLFAWFCR
jgi:hypothetical protein